jgi:hypothetical protein
MGNSSRAADRWQKVVLDGVAISERRCPIDATF